MTAAGKTEITMDSNEHAGELPERIGNVLSIILLLALAALFAYGYAPRFAYSIFG
jgi:hypothetical protein